MRHARQTHAVTPRPRNPPQPIEEQRHAWTESFTEGLFPSDAHYLTASVSLAAPYPGCNNLSVSSWQSYSSIVRQASPCCCPGSRGRSHGVAESASPSLIFIGLHETTLELPAGRRGPAWRWPRPTTEHRGPTTAVSRVLLSELPSHQSEASQCGLKRSAGRVCPSSVWRS